MTMKQNHDSEIIENFKQDSTNESEQPKNEMERKTADMEIIEVQKPNVESPSQNQISEIHESQDSPNNLRGFFNFKAYL